MSLSIGIVGLPNVGKSTLFNALTNKSAEASNYPFCTIEPNVGVVKVPDERLDKIAAISKPARIMPATIEFVDIAGLVKDAHKGEGLGNQFLANIRECDAVCEVVRVFKNDDIMHVNGRIDPDDDRETIALELIFADLNTIEKKWLNAQREAKSGNKEAAQARDIFARLKEHLERGLPARTLSVKEDEQKIFKELSLLSMKPIIYVLNSDGTDGEEFGNDWDGEIIKLNVKTEEEIASLPPEEQPEYIAELGLKESGLDKLIKSSYRLLGLITFFTTGPMETRAWTVNLDAKAPVAAGRIHSDFEKGFIRAEIISYDDFISAGGESSSREKGLIRIEGKDYQVKDGDICHFLVNKLAAK